MVDIVFIYSRPPSVASVIKFTSDNPERSTIICWVVPMSFELSVNPAWTRFGFYLLCSVINLFRDGRTAANLPTARWSCDRVGGTGQS